MDKALAIHTDSRKDYFIRAMAKVALGRSDACRDLRKADELGYEDAAMMIEKYCR